MISAGAFHTAALLGDGSLYTWGYNEVGQLGIGTTDNALIPTRALGFPRGTPP
jgi:alpha-tubulin suppressor-like RCC1 family protein